LTNQRGEDCYTCKFDAYRPTVNDISRAETAGNRTSPSRKS